VPAVVLGAIALQLALYRRNSNNIAAAHGVCVASAGALIFALRAAAEVPAWSTSTWLWEWPLLAFFGMAAIPLSSRLHWTEDEHGESLAAWYGLGLCSLATGFACMQWMLLGPEIPALLRPNTCRVDIIIMCLLLLSGALLTARRYLQIEAARWLAPALTVCAYAVFMLKAPLVYSEWISVPTAVFLFAMARECARGAGAIERRSEVTLLLGAASAVATLPSLCQAIAYTPEGALHALLLLLIGLSVIGGAMLTRRKIPLLCGCSAILAVLIIKGAQWAAHREMIMPLLGIMIGMGVLALGMFFEARMNRSIRLAVDRARAEAQMFWVSWE
jgi:hypothetical protein